MQACFCVFLIRTSAPRLALGAFRWIQYSYEPLCSETLLNIEIGDQGGFFRKDTITVNSILKIRQTSSFPAKQLSVFRFAHLSVDGYLGTEFGKVGSHSEIVKVSLPLPCTPNP